MKTGVLMLAVAANAFAVGSVATAAGGWQLVQSDEASGSNSITAHINTSVTERPKALALRLAGGSGAATVNWRLTCTSPKDKVLPPQRLWAVGVATAESCKVTATARRDEGGRVLLLLLRRLS